MNKPQAGQKKNAPTQGKRARREARRRAARRRRMITRASWAGGGLLVVGLVTALVIASIETGDTTPEAWDLPAMGPTAEVRDRVALADFQGRPTVVNFFASWCVECDRELPGFRTVSAELRDQVHFVGVASQETGDPLFMPRRHEILDWTLARDINGLNGSGLSRALGARGMPLTAFYDAGGALLHVQLGTILEPQLRAMITQLFGIDATAA